MTPCRWILFADLDGTVLDSETYAPGPSSQALEMCSDAGVPVILNSSKTRAEMEPLCLNLPMCPDSPFISENGGGIFYPSRYRAQPPGAEKDGELWRMTLGTSHEVVLGVLRQVGKELGIRIRFFSDLSDQEVSSLTGLPLFQAGLARQREFDEPFWVEDQDSADLKAFGRLIEKKGISLTRGGRFFHGHGNSDKGRAAGYVQQLYQKSSPSVRSAGVGDAANDLPLFRVVEKAYLVKKADGTHDPDIPAEDNIRFLEEIGPDGFLQAVEDLLEHIDQ